MHRPHLPPDLSMLEDFGQRVDLTRRIREVLLNYPEGTTVLKELIQNADDAGASTVRLCLDRRNHPAGSLLSSELAQWQGPALIAYNDAVFTEDDFASISRIGDSKKHGQASKTGRFGVGFNSVYHLTDLPSFVSDKYVVLFDPQGAYLPNVSAANPGKRIEFVSTSALSLYKDQFVPYCAFGCDMKTPFPGTLFRFPLRSVNQAATSKLSRQAYSEDDIFSMFSQLFREAVFTMLFLKSIISIEMYVWESDAYEPQKMYSCSVGSSNKDIAWHRQALMRFSRASESSNWQMDSFSLDFLSESFFGTNMEKRTDRFFIVQGMAPALSKIGTFATTAAKEYDLKLLPWASVAACISDDTPEDYFLKQGQAFCFLPLPVKTGLGVQVNAYFEVSTNRRSIWYGADMDRGGKLRSDWNMLLLEDVVAPLYNELLLGVRKQLGPTKQYYSLWPAASFEEPWDILVKQVYKVIYLSPVIHTICGDGNWISPYEAFIHDVEYSKGNGLGEALVLLGMPVVHLPRVLVRMLFKYYADYSNRVVSPMTVRNFLKECKTLFTLSRAYKLVLLEYCLSDLNNAYVGEHANGLALLPLASGEFGSFSEASGNMSYFICNELEYKLLSVVPDKIIDRDIPLDLFNKISEIAKSSKANIGFLNGPSFLQLFPMFFSAEWRCKNRVSWDPESAITHPTAAWFVLFWKYLSHQSYDLEVFSEWPILPSTSGYLYRASELSKLVKAEILSSSMKVLLSNIGCKILHPKYGVDHQQLPLYVYDDSASGVVDAIFDTTSSYGNNQMQMLFQDISVDEKNELRQFLLDPKWYYANPLSDIHKEKCKKLPIYRVYNGGYPVAFHFSQLAISKNYLPPVNVPEYFLDCSFINCTSQSEEEILVRFYGLERMRKTIFYKRNILNRLGDLQQEFRDTIMLSILQDLPQLSLDDSSFKESLRILNFVPTISGKLMSPQSLYDPRNEELYALLEDSDCFPSGVFQEPGSLDMLLLLGLRTLVSADTIIESARQIESLMQRDQMKASVRGKVLLSYLEVNSIKWSSNASNQGKKRVNMRFPKTPTMLKARDLPYEVDIEKFWNDLRMICWCPVLTTTPHLALPWPSVSSMVAPPKLVRPKADMWLVSGSTRILDGECSSFLSFNLGWSSPPGGSTIAAQLLELGKNNEIVTDQVLRQELTLAIPKIYALLTKLIGSDDMDIVRAILEGCRWIWVGDGFATGNEVVLNGHLHLAPYIRVIPVDLAVFRELFLELGIQEFLKPMDYANILCRMATRKGCDPLDGQELRVSIMVVQYLSESHFQALQVQIYLPDVSSRLFPASDLVFNDAPWLLDSAENTSEKNAILGSRRNVHNFVHGNISHDVAEKLGVRSLRRSLLAESSDSMNLSLSGVAEAFGQHEALTTRLKHIVEMYADGPGILFELVQNAEDAHASEVVFLLDKTRYGTSSILSPDMADWQGPALYCFNDSIFSSHDLYAISRIGQDSKLEKPFAIGRFGLGFNCVYHFTDIPSFVSGENIVIFDPHACYLPGISASHPGLRIKFIGRKILEQFPDQFTPFLHFGCNLHQSFPGTLFRFPLRSESTASRSQIKKEKYAPEEVESLFSSFSGVVSETLLFLRNVKKISIFVKDDADHEMKLIHRVSRRAVTGLGRELHPLHSMLDFVHGIQQSGMDRDQFLNKLGKTIDRDLPWNCQKVTVLEENHSGFTEHFWMISECIGGGRAKTKSVIFDKKSHNFIPWACVCAYLHSVNLKDSKEEECCDSVDVRHRKSFEGRAFCFLPLPISTGLPTHLNAYFELSSNRRDIWFGNDMAGGGRVRSEWNIYLLEDVAAPAYGHLLASIAQEIGPCDLFFSFWPTVVGPEPWASMVRKLYVSITDLGLPVLYTKARGGQWISTTQAIFPDFTFPKAVELAEALSEANLPMVTISKPMVDRFMEACPSLHFLTPHFLRILLIRRNRGFGNREAMITALEYCLSDIQDSLFYEKLHGLPLVPLATGVFTLLRKRGEGERVFVTSQTEYDLLKDFVPHLLVDRSIPNGVLQKLRDIALFEQSNLCVLTCDFLVELFPRVFPTEWQHAKQVSWNPGHLGQPTLEWIVLLWSYLKESCTDLSVFSKWPILPVKHGYLLQLARNSNVIRDEGWSENMASLLQKLGFFFLRCDLAIDHPQLRYFVQDETASGILNAVQAAGCQLQDIKVLFTNASNGEMHELRSFLLQSKWFSGDQMDSRQIDIIKLLPMFESYKSRELVSLGNPNKWLKPEGIHDRLLDENFIRPESDRETHILRSYLKIKVPSKSEFYQEYVLSHMSRFISDDSDPSILSAILLDLKLLVEEDISLKMALSRAPFILAPNGSWQHPSRLYDPRVPGLQNLLHKDIFFPCDKFLQDEILEALVSLGLKRTLGFSGLLDSARSVSMLHDSGNIDAVCYGRRLLACLNSLACKFSNNNSEEQKHDEYPQTETIRDRCHECDQDLLPFLSSFVYDKPEEEFWTEITTISWCPVYVSPPVQGLPWCTSGNYIAPPSITRPKSQMWIVSSELRILDGHCCSNYLQHKLGWMDSPDIRVLSTQLIELSKFYTQIKVQPEDLIRVDLERGILSLYSKLQGFVGSEDFKILKQAANDFPSIWIGDDFVSPKSLAFDSPVKYHPYLYAVPTELSEFRDLLSELGVKLTFDGKDYLHVLQCLQHDLKGEPLSDEQLGLVHRLLEAFSDCYADRQVPDALLNSLLIPDSSGILMHGLNLVYNDAPWLRNNNLTTKHFVHPIISDDLAQRLGVHSLRCSSLVDEEMMTDLPCMNYAKICELLAFYGDRNFILFDLLELADYCKARKLHLVYDKREHPRQSLLQHNLGDFQGPALTVVLEGVSLNREEICNLQLPPPWKIRGKSLNYGLGLISSFFICDLLTIVSGDYLYMFDPLGLALAAPSSNGPSAKLFSLKGTDLMERFHDQFSPLLINKEISLSTSVYTIVRMPLSPKCMKELESGCKRVNQIFDQFMHNGSSSLLFLKSVLQVSLSTWDEGELRPSLDFSACIDPSLAIIRNPFSEKKWRKFHISRLFSSSSAAVKMHVIDIQVTQRDTNFLNKWFVVLCLGSGQTRNMALDRRYLSYDLTPVAGVAALISQNGRPVVAHPSSCILSPLPLSGMLSMPVTALGNFLICHNGGRYLFNHPYEMPAGDTYHLIQDWNRELMLCIRDSYIEMILEFQKLRKDPSSSTLESNYARDVGYILQAYGDRVYSFWPRSKHRSSSSNELDFDNHDSGSTKETGSDWECLIERVIRPFYARLVELPVWQLYRGSFVKADEGMFLSQLGNEEGDTLLPATVYSYIKEHYPVFSVPGELVKEIQAVGIKVREIKPKMVRDLLKSSAVVLRSIETHIDILDYCLSDICSTLGTSGMQNLTIDTYTEPSSSNLNLQRYDQNAPHTPTSSGGDALELVTYFGKALYDFGRGVVEDMGRVGGPLDVNGIHIDSDHPLKSILGELKGLPFPTATMCLANLGTVDLWIGSKEQQLLMRPLADNFIHPQCLEKPALAECLYYHNFHGFLRLKHFSLQLLSSNLRLLFSRGWTNSIIENSGMPWFSWDNGPSPEWIRLFWKIFRELGAELSLVSSWPLIPAFLDGPVLCRVKEHRLIFVPPVTTPAPLSEINEGVEMLNPFPNDIVVEDEVNKSYLTAFELTKSRYPWLMRLLNQFNVPIYDISFLNCGALSYLCPTPDQSLGQVIVSKLLATKLAGYFSEPDFLSSEDRDSLFTLFASDSSCMYKREELDLMRELPIYKTVTGAYTKLFGSDQCIIPSTAFFHPSDERCLSSSEDDRLFFHALGVSQLNDQEVFVKFALPGFEGKNIVEQEDILLYMYKNWTDLQFDSTVLGILKETKFVRSADELCTQLFKPRDLLDPCDSLLTSVFSGDGNKFPGERFAADGWLRILRKAGLRTSSQADTILECARKVEMLGTEAMEHSEDPDDFGVDFITCRNELSFEVWSLAGSVVDSIFTNFAVLYDNTFCEKLGGIAFIPAEKGFPSIRGKKGGKRILCCYSEAILLKDWPLAWSCAPILAKQNVVPPEYSWGAFRLRSPPAFTIVLKHLQMVGRNNGEDTLAHWPTSSDMMSVEDAFFEILKYLDKIWGTISPSDIVELQKVAFVPVANGTRMVTVKSLFTRLTVNLSPFAFELPSLYLPFVKILKELGMQEVLSADYAKDLLIDIQRSCGYQRLNPNELRAASEILNFICDEDTQSVSERPEWSNAIVPDEGCRLVLARSCVYIDPPGSRFLGNIDTSRLRFAHPELPEDICMNLGIKRLSDIVVEELYEEPALQVLDMIGSVPLNRITAKFLSKSLQDAVWVLFNSIATHFPSFQGPTLSTVQTSLAHMAEGLQFVRCLHTRFLLLPNFSDITRIAAKGSIPEWEDGTRHRTIHFVDKSGNRVLVADPPSYMSVYDVIAVVVSQYLGAPSVLPLGPLFACPDSREREILRVLKLGSENGFRKREGRSSAFVGNELLPQDALRVQFLPLRPFYNGEIVAWKTGKDGEKLRYGRVPEDVRPSSGQAVHRFSVEISPGVTQGLLSTQVFSFRSVSMANDVPVTSLPEKKENVVNNGMLHGQASKNEQKAIKDLQYGRVSTTEVVQAVHDMLSAAGINMDDEKQTLLQTTLTLQERFKESQVSLLVAQEKAEAASREADAAKAAWSCRVCLSSEVDIAIVPCGHILCHRCSSAVSRCPFCRLNVSRTMKIFRP